MKKIIHTIAARRITRLFILGILFGYTQTFSQEFITPFEAGGITAQKCIVIKENGEQIEGKMRWAFGTGRGLKTVKLLLPSGEKVTFKASELRELTFKNNTLTKIISTAEQSASIRKASEANWEQIYNQEYIRYNKATLPSGKSVMMQMINPDFSSRIQVYFSQGSSKTSGIGVPLAGGTLKITGGRQRAYWVSKDNGKVFKLRRGGYNKKKFERLFGDSPEMLKTYGRPYRFSEFSEHVYMYDKLNKE
jgi:hypothetical protein